MAVAYTPPAGIRMARRSALTAWSSALGSSSSSASSSSSLSSPLTPLVYSRRHASTLPRLAESTSSNAPTGSGGLQAANQKILEARRMAEKVQRQGLTIDPKTFETQAVFVPKTDTPFQWHWLKAHRGSEDQKEWWTRKYFGRTAMLWASRQGFGQLLDMRVVKGKPTPFPMIRSMRKMGKQWLETEVQEIYETFNEAQAEGDIKTLQQVANGPALREASRIASLGRKMEWRIKTPSEGGAGSIPMIIWVAVTALPEFPELNVAQICVRFDTTQVLTLNSVKQNALQPPPSRVQRVVEYVVLEKVFPKGGEWKIKDKVNAETPKWVKDWETGKAMPLSQYLLSFLPTWLGGTPAGENKNEKK